MRTAGLLITTLIQLRIVELSGDTSACSNTDKSLAIAPGTHLERQGRNRTSNRTAVRDQISIDSEVMS